MRQERAIQATIFEVFAGARGGDPLAIEITGTNLVWSARHNPFGGENTVFNQTNFVIADAKVDAGLCRYNSAS